jgi:FAD:protein FMN transferase
VELDLGSTAKALAVDRAAVAAWLATGAGADTGVDTGGAGTSVETGVLVSLGGDIAVAGTPPPGGWPILVTDDHASPLDSPGQTVSIRSGGLATSSTTVRRWRRGDAVLHHIVDPRTGRPAAPWWRTATVTAASCVDANIAATAAIVLGPDGPAWLDRLHLPARLVRVGGAVQVVGDWPTGGD